MMKKAFSLMEMMVVLLIVSVVAAASAPMLNKKILTTAAERSPWVRTEGLSIAFNLNGDNNTSATIGAIRPSSGRGVPRLAIETSGNTTPHISFGRNGSRVAGLWLGTNGILFGNHPNDSDVSLTDRQISIGDIIIKTQDNYNIPERRGIISIGYKNGASAMAKGQIAIGCTNGNPDANSFNNAITIGHGVRLESLVGPTPAWGHPAVLSNPENSIAIGAGVFVQGKDCVTIGTGASSLNSSSVAIGGTAEVQGQGSIALGHGAKSEFDDAIAIGDTAGVKAMASYTSSEWNKPIGSISIGKEAICPNGKNAIAIGQGTWSYGDGSIAIGRSASAGFPDGNLDSVGAAIAIGDDASAEFENSVAIGAGATTKFANSVAIGAGVTTKATNQIVLGSPADTVYIPGNLVVGKKAYIGVDNVTPKHENATNLYLKFNNGQVGKIFERIGGGNYLEWWDTDDHTNEVKELLNSDRRLKDVGKAFVGGLEEIKKLEVFNYTYKKDKTKTPHVGVMAQDLEKIFPKAVFKGEDGFLRIRMEDMFYALVNAVKELDKKIDLLAQKQKKIDELEKTVDKLEKRLAELEKKMK